ncbi:DUF2637 domain-containing protein, partial [Streptomyces sp. NPDC002073]
PVLFVVTVEAARHAVGRIADITADRHMEGVRITRWLLSPIPTFKLWRRKAPVEALMPLRLARIGVPLAQTGPSGLAAAGIEPLLPPAPAEAVVSEALAQPDRSAQPALAAAAEVPSPVVEWGEEPLLEDLEESSVGTAEGEAGVAAQQGAAAAVSVDWLEAGGEFIARYGQFPTAEQLAALLAQAYGVIDPATSGLLADEVLEPVLADLRAAAFGAAADPPHEASGEPDEGAAEVGESPRAAVSGTTAAPSEAHPFFGKPVSVDEPARSESVTRAPVAAPSASVATGTMTHAASDGQWSADASATASKGQAPLWTAEVTDTGAATARVPQQQSAGAEGDPIQQEIELVAKWLAEAEDAGKKLSGAENGGRVAFADAQFSGANVRWGRLRPPEDGTG